MKKRSRKKPDRLIKYSALTFKKEMYSDRFKEMLQAMGMRNGREYGVMTWRTGVWGAIYVFQFDDREHYKRAYRKLAQTKMVNYVERSRYM